MTDRGDRSLLSYFNRDTELWRRRARNTVAYQRQLVRRSIPDLYTSLTSATRPNPYTTTAIQSLAEQVQLPDFVDPIEHFTEEDSRSESMTTGISPKHLCTESEDNALDVGAFLEKAADRFSACKDAKIDSMMENLDTRIDEKVDSKLGPVMVRLLKLENQVQSAQGVDLLQRLMGHQAPSRGHDICVFLPWKSRDGVLSRSKHDWIDRGTGKRIYQQAANRELDQIWTA